MGGAITFRSVCKLCDEVFFSSQREVPYCPRCAKRIGYRPPRTEARPQTTPTVVASEIADPAPVQVASVPSTPPPATLPSPRTSPAPAAPPGRSSIRVERGTSFEGGERGANNEGPREITVRSGSGNATAGTARPGARTNASKPAARPPRGAPAPPAPPKAPVVISPALRLSIEHAYDYYAAEPEFTLKDIIDRICFDFGLDRQPVHEITAPRHGERLRQQSIRLSSDQRREIFERYARMVEQGIRPPGGRRRSIAREMGLTQNAVALAVAQWRSRRGDPHQLTREEKFQIERAFFQAIGTISGFEAPCRGLSPLADVVSRVAEHTSIQRGAVENWIDKLFDDPRPLNHVAPITESLARSIEAKYREYLSAERPPEASLHAYLATQFNCTLRQVHRTVLLYRWRERLGAVPTEPEDREMVDQSLAAAQAA